MNFVTSSFCCRLRAISPTREKLETLTLTPGYTEPALPILKLHLWGKFFRLTPRRLTFSDLVEQCKFFNPRCILTSAASRQPQNMRFASRTICRIIQFLSVVFSFNCACALTRHYLQSYSKEIQKFVLATLKFTFQSTDLWW